MVHLALQRTAGRRGAVRAEYETSHRGGGRKLVFWNAEFSEGAEMEFHADLLRDFKADSL